VPRLLLLFCPEELASMKKPSKFPFIVVLLINIVDWLFESSIIIINYFIFNRYSGGEDK